MVKSCVAYGCSNRWTTGSGIQFHLFPLSRPELLKKWVHAVRREYWKPSKYSVICSAHFTKDSYLLRPGAIKQLLKDDAVPSLFSFPSHLQGKISRSRKLDQNKPTVSEKLGRSRKKLRKCDDYEEGDKMDAVVQQIIMNPPEVIIKEEPVVKEEAECDVGAGAQQNFEYVSVKEEPIEDPDESTYPAPEESSEQMGQHQELPLIIKEEIDCDDYIDPFRIS